ncbi:MAG: type II toxin-antitoxin system VapC family toxin [Solirubrobacterales bacterium]|nr:type II toxin-antitoxin system VapC family toxin [Solirubrobacterales bacterium]
MIVDSSALMAVLYDEPGRAWVRKRISEATRVQIGAPTLLETEIVLCSQLGPAGRGMLLGLVRAAGLQVIPFEPEHARLAGDAFLRYGKGRHPAALNFGDCMTYAVARHSHEPLLFVGDDFPHTDLELVAS